jgi:hypothetical protein
MLSGWRTQFAVFKTDVSGFEESAWNSPLADATIQAPRRCHTVAPTGMKGMSMTPQERTEFVDAYTRLLITTWSDEEFAARLHTDIIAAMKEVGLEVPADAVVERVRELPETQLDGGLDVQLEAWERGIETGHFYLHIPETPEFDMAELTEGELEGVAAGSYVCCCCCPCCSC